MINSTKYDPSIRKICPRHVERRNVPSNYCANKFLGIIDFNRSECATAAQPKYYRSFLTIFLNQLLIVTNDNVNQTKTQEMRQILYSLQCVRRRLISFLKH